MDLIALAVPFFLIALLAELAVDRLRGTGHYRTNDAVNSLSAGTLSTTFGYFTRLFPAVIWAFVLQNFALIDPQVYGPVWAATIAYILVSAVTLQIPAKK